MPRPSLKAERREELLDAFMRCVARYGLDGSTLERISTEAGVGRPLLRHYLGNREQMVSLLLDHILEKFAEMTDMLIASLPTNSRVDALVEIIFNSQYHSPENASVFQALIAASERHPVIINRLMSFVDGFEAAIAGELSRENPQADVENCRVAAAGIAAIYFNHDATLPLQPTKLWRDRQKAAVQMLIQALK